MQEVVTSSSHLKVNHLGEIQVERVEIILNGARVEAENWRRYTWMEMESKRVVVKGLFLVGSDCGN